MIHNNQNKSTVLFFKTHLQFESTYVGQNSKTATPVFLNTHDLTKNLGKS